MVDRWKPLIVILITLVLAVSLEQDFFLFLLGFEVMVWLASWGQVMWLSRRLGLHVCIPDNMVFRGETFDLQLVLNNRSRLPVPQLMARASVRVYPEKEELLLRGKLMLGGGETGKLCFRLDSSHCACLEVRPNQLTVTDYLGLAQVNCRLDNQDTHMLFILPESLKDGGEVPDDRQLLSGEDGEAERAGHTAVDVAEIRQYQPGDMVKLIHWKLSARLEELMVREMSDPADPTVRIWLELGEADGKTHTRLDKDKWDHWMQTVAGVSAALLSTGRKHMVVWADAGQHALKSRLVTDEDSQRMMLCELLRVQTYFGEDYKTLFREMNAGEAEETWIEIDLQGRIDRSAAS